MLETRKKTWCRKAQISEFLASYGVIIQSVISHKSLHIKPFIFTRKAEFL